MNRKKKQNYTVKRNYIKRIKPRWLNAEVKRDLKLKHELWNKIKSKGKHQTMNRTELISDGDWRTTLAITEMEKDLGIFVRADGKWSDQVNSAASKANRTLGMMKKTFKCWSDDIMRIICPTFIRPHLQFASSVWIPHRKKDIEILETVQRRATTKISPFIL